MLDFDLAEMYQVENKNLKRAVRRNIERFPDDFMFEITKYEYDSLRCNFGTFEKQGRGQHSKYLPFAFTEQGVAQLSSVLNSPYAIDVNIKIIRAFVAVRTYLNEYASTSKEIARIWERVKELEEVSDENTKAINDLSEDTGRNFDDIYIALSELAAKQKSIHEAANKPRRPIGYIQPKENNPE
jgi:hypothetical protein